LVVADDLGGVRGGRREEEGGGGGRREEEGRKGRTGLLQGRGRPWTLELEAKGASLVVAEESERRGTREREGEGKERKGEGRGRREHTSPTRPLKARSPRYPLNK
jgi:hypothetical protein